MAPASGPLGAGVPVQRGIEGGAGDVAEHRSGLDAGQLARVAHQDDPGLGGQRIEQVGPSAAATPSSPRRRSPRRRASGWPAWWRKRPCGPGPEQAVDGGGARGIHPVGQLVAAGRAELAGPASRRPEGCHPCGPPPCRWGRPGRPAGARGSGGRAAWRRRAATVGSSRCRARRRRPTGCARSRRWRPALGASAAGAPGRRAVEQPPVGRRERRVVAGNDGGAESARSGALGRGSARGRGGCRRRRAGCGAVGRGDEG